MWDTVGVETVVESLHGRGRIVAGGDGSDRRVRRARTLFTVEELGEAGAEDFVVTTVEVLRATGVAPLDLVGRLGAAGVAALGVVHDGAPALPTGLGEAADRWAVPIVAFAAEVRCEDVAAVVLEAVLDAQRRRFAQVLDIQQSFTPIALAGGGAAEVAAAVYERVGCPVMITSATGRPTVVVPADGGGLDPDGPWVRQPILAGDRALGEIVACIEPAALDADGRLVLEQAALSVAVRLVHAGAAAAEQEGFAVLSLEELIAGHAADVADVTERAISFGWDLARPRAVLLASIDPPTDPATVSPALATIAAAARATLGRDAIVWTRTTTIAALVAPETDASAERRHLAEGLRRELDERVTEVTVSIGVGRRVDDPSGLARSYLEASRAVDVGRWVHGRHVTEVFDELGLERLLAATPTEDLAEFVEHAIGRLVEHDRLHRTELVATLGMWLETRNIAEAARRCHVHYNTFKNRLDRVESILGAVVTDPERSLECEVAIYVFRHYDGPWRVGAS